MSEFISYESAGVPIHAWVRGVSVEDAALQQLKNVASLPFVFRWVAAMPDVHWGIGATVGSVIPTRRAIIPAAVGVDIGCGMTAVRTSLTANDLPDDLGAIRSSIERAVPHGFAKGRGVDRGSWGDAPNAANKVWAGLRSGWEAIAEKFPVLERGKHVTQLGTLGSGNHFIEVCLDEADHVWVMLHSGSRGVGNRIGTFFIELAKRDMEHLLGTLPDRDLAYFDEGTQHFDDYVHAVDWAQRYARANREIMMDAVLASLRARKTLPTFTTADAVIDCHHNYVNRETHFGEEVLVTRKGAVSAREGELGIIPGSMGARSFIVRGKGNPASFHSCSHGAGRAMSRTQARKTYTVEDHVRATKGVECRKDAGVIDETPMAYKDIDKVMAAQRDLIDVVHTLRQVVCVKG
jgi:tRNA-splicing ligase RtcB